MAAGQINVFQNEPMIERPDYNLLGANTLHIHGVYMPGSLSFNNVIMALSQSATEALIGTATISFGLYSLNGSTLSLANSASGSISFSTTYFSWISLITSAIQNITPGNWYLGVISSTSVLGGLSFLVNTTAIRWDGQAYAGQFVRGIFSKTTGSLMASIATSDLVNEGSSTNNLVYIHPYIIISA